MTKYRMVVTANYYDGTDEEWLYQHRNKKQMQLIANEFLMNDKLSSLMLTITKEKK